MARRRRRDTLAGDLEATRAAASIGADLKRTRLRRRFTLEQLADRTGLSRSRLQELEAGGGSSAPLRVWFELGAALERPFAAGFSRDLLIPPEPADAGHLAAQEAVLELARAAGRTGLFELPTRPSVRDGGHVDVGLRDDVSRVLMLIEIWNRLTDLGSASRSTQRKRQEAEALAAFRGYRVASCWLLVDTAANREIARRYPAVLRAMFGGSSLAWARCLIDGEAPPVGPGIAWIDPRDGRIRPMRLRGAA
jgi:transcriptional regulator with XRE-family HTH domain